MAPTSLTVLHSAFLSLTGVALGRLVTDISNPSQDFWPESKTPLSPDEVDLRPFDNLKSQMNDNSNAALKTRLTRFVSGEISTADKSSFDLVSSKANVYSLLQPRRYFLQLCAEDKTKKWIEDTLKDCPIFLVVGLMTVLQASISRDDNSSRQMSTSISVPVTDIVTSGASTALPSMLGGDALDVGASASIGRTTSVNSSLIAPGERVIGVQYRKVKFRMFSSHKIENSYLDSKNPNRWQMFTGGDRGESDDIIEADVDGEMELDDLELDRDADVVDGGFVFLDDLSANGADS
jgi:hypothetical protein